jgi:hypothetical protein
MLLDLNTAEEQRRDLIPDGVFAPLRASIRPGEYTLPNTDTADVGLFKASRSSDAVMLEFEFTVLAGPHAKRKFWQSMTVQGGKTDENGVSLAWNITKSSLRAMAESALGVSPKDMSAEAQAKRRLPNFKSVDGLEFIAKIGVERGSQAPDGGQYADKNKIAHIVTPDEPEWATIRQGGEIAPRPTGGEAGVRAAGANLQAKLHQHLQPKPAWQQEPQQEPAAAAPAKKGPSWMTES